MITTPSIAVSQVAPPGTLAGSAASAGRAPRRGQREEQDDFASVLLQRMPGSRGSTPEEKIREISQEFVSVALVQPILANLRSTNSAWGPFAPGAHEKQFGQMADAAVAMRITRAKNFPIVAAVERSLRRSLERVQ